MDAMIHPLPHPIIVDAVQAALREDLGLAGDVTSQATLSPSATARCAIQAREPGVLAGQAVAQAAFAALSPAITYDAHCNDGTALKPGDRIATIEGPAVPILSAERVALNFLTHMSGIASATAQFAKAIAHTDARVTCTRKTLPGLRAFAKYAVKAGGGSNHRYGLDDAILIKDNHIGVAGGVKPALERAKSFAGHLVKIEIEVDTLEQFRQVLDTKLADVVLLDNMPPETLREAIAMNAAHARSVVLEASGGITLETVAAVAETGVDFISSGWITMSSPSLDLGLDIAIDQG